MFRGTALGLMELIETERERHFTTDELELARGLAEQAAVAVHNAAPLPRAEGARRAPRRDPADQPRHRRVARRRRGDRAVTKGIVGLFPACATTAEIMLASDDERFCPAALAGRRDDGGQTCGPARRRPRRPRPRRPRRRLQEPWDYGRRLVVPLVAAAPDGGYLDVRCDRSRRISADEIQLVQILMNQAAVALENAANFARLETTYLETVTALAAAMEAKDHYTADHADMLARMAVSVGRRLGLSESELRDLQYASVLHDIGKIGHPRAASSTSRTS
jgi:GAF domain-containing protein